MRRSLAVLACATAIAGGVESSGDRPQEAEAHTWYCGHSVLYTSPGAQRERYVGKTGPGHQHIVSTERYAPSGSYWYVLDRHIRYCPAH